MIMEAYILFGNRTTAEFAMLPPTERRDIFCQYLRQDDPVIVEESEVFGCMNRRMPAGAILRQEFFVGQDTIGKQLVKEATETYYGENDFYVRLHWLCEFKTDDLADGFTPVTIPPLVHKTITVEAELHDESHLATEDIEYDGGTLAQWTEKRFQDLFLFSNAERIVLVLRGDGAVDGSDPATQRTIQDITPVVKELIRTFGGRFSIEKRLYADQYASQSLGRYWQTE